MLPMSRPPVRSGQNHNFHGLSHTVTPLFSFESEDTNLYCSGGVYPVVSVYPRRRIGPHSEPSSYDENLRKFSVS